MPSLQSYLFRWIVQYYLAPQYRRAGQSISKWRKLMDLTTRFQRIPTGTQIVPVLVRDTAAEWVWAPSVTAERAALYLHGGAFVMGSPATHRELAARLSAASGARMLVLDYRLSPEHPFPAAMQDALSAYCWLLDEGYEPKQVAIGGDSAGGGLALQSLIALRDGGGQLPAAGFFMSPVTDWVRFDGESYTTRAGVDPWITESMCRFTSAAYVSDNDPETPLLYPTAINLSGLPPLCIHVGDHELLLSDSTRLAERAQAAGVEVEFKVWESMVHVFQAGASFVPEARQSLAEIGRFVRDRMG
jgi:monoterpene epsilon-lactone hydrolase